MQKDIIIHLIVWRLKSGEAYIGKEYLKKNHEISQGAEGNKISRVFLFYLNLKVIQNFSKESQKFYNFFQEHELNRGGNISNMTTYDQWGEGGTIKPIT